MLDKEEKTTAVIASTHVPKTKGGVRYVPSRRVYTVTRKDAKIAYKTILRTYGGTVSKKELLELVTIYIYNTS